jgi:hypothetical protein
MGAAVISGLPEAAGGASQARCVPRSTCRHQFLCQALCSCCCGLVRTARVFMQRASTLFGSGVQHLRVLAAGR